jgi:hypothetical protein
MDSIELYLEAMDAAARIAFNILGRQKNHGKTFSEALPINCNGYAKLNHPSDHRARIYGFCKSKNYKNAIIETYAAFSEYMKNILKEMYETAPIQVVGKSKKILNLQFHEIVNLGDFESIKNKMIADVFRSLENERSTIKLIDKIIDGTGVSITDYDKNAVLPYLEMRHLFMHNNGKIDEKFESNYGAAFGLNKNNKVPTNYDNASKAILETSKFVKKLDQELLNQNHIQAL